MINIQKILNNNFNYLFILPYIFWLIFIIFYATNSDIIKKGDLDGLVFYTVDSYDYIDNAKNLLNFELSNLHTSKLSYIFLISIALFLNLSLTSIVIFQFFTTIISSFCLYLICKKMFSKWVGLICLFFFITYIPIQLRNFFILTEILFVNLSIILLYLCFFKRDHKILILLISLFILFLRPQGFLIILSLFFTIVILKRLNRNYNIIINVVLIFTSLFLFIFFLNIGIQDYNLISSLSRGLIWGYSFDTNSICKKECIQGFTNPDLYEKNIFQFFLYVKDNFLIILKVSFYKIILFFSGWRPYYSNLHNIYKFIYHLPIFILFCAYFFNLKKLNPFETFSIFYMILSVLFVSVTFVDWSGRYVMTVLPIMMIYASSSLVKLMSFLAKRYKNNV